MGGQRKQHKANICIAIDLRLRNCFAHSIPNQCMWKNSLRSTQMHSSCYHSDSLWDLLAPTGLLASTQKPGQTILVMRLPHLYRPPHHHDHTTKQLVCPNKPFAGPSDWQPPSCHNSSTRSSDAEDAVASTLGKAAPVEHEPRHRGQRQQQPAQQ